MDSPIFSDEILLQIFPSLPLVGLIRARGVCKKWRKMLYETGIDPLRLRFLEFYIQAVQFHTFLPSRPWVLENLVDFDRAAFIARLEPNFIHISEDFKMWIMEWPAKAVIGPVWPGLPSRCRTDRRFNENTTNALCISAFPEHHPYTLEIFPILEDDDFARFEDGSLDVDSAQRTAIPVQTLLLCQWGDFDDNIALLGTDLHPRVKGRIVVDLIGVAFDDERVDLSSSFKDVLSWLSSELEQEREPAGGLPHVPFINPARLW